VTGSTVSVIIPAFNAEATLSRAMASALAQPETAEVIVVDDASPDGTGAIARAAAADDRRVRVVHLDANGGPARARNAGINASRSPWIAVLDADDIFMPARLARLCALPAHDMAADDIAFVAEDAAAACEGWRFPQTDGLCRLDPESFARGNIGGRRQRGELGFLKPVMSRNFLDRHDLRYDETLRLGEDVDLYLRALLAGARFVLTRKVGYAATVRPGSLSASHNADDLAALERALSRHLQKARPASAEFTAIRDLCAQLRQRCDHRRFLDRKSARGFAAAARFAFAERGRAGPIARGVLRDKLGGTPPPVIPTGARFRTLFGGQDPLTGTTSSRNGSDAASERVSPGRSSTLMRRAFGR
jgi:succinoglycan biosynthesis protein ExoU